jgi:hypothetical protein
MIKKTATLFAVGLLSLLTTQALFARACSKLIKEDRELYPKPTFPSRTATG